MLNVTVGSAAGASTLIAPRLKFGGAVSQAAVFATFIVIVALPDASEVAVSVPPTHEPRMLSEPPSRVSSTLNLTATLGIALPYASSTWATIVAVVVVARSTTKSAVEKFGVTTVTELTVGLGRTLKVSVSHVHVGELFAVLLSVCILLSDA